MKYSQTDVEELVVADPVEHLKRRSVDDLIPVLPAQNWRPERLDHGQKVVIGDPDGVRDVGPVGLHVRYVPAHLQGDVVEALAAPAGAEPVVGPPLVAGVHLHPAHHLVQRVQLVEDVLGEQRPSAGGGDDQPHEVTGVRDATRAERREVGREQPVGGGALLPRAAVRRREEVLGVVLVAQLLHARGGQQREHDGQDEEVAGPAADVAAQTAELAAEQAVHHPQRPAAVHCELLLLPRVSPAVLRCWRSGLVRGGRRVGQ